MRKFKIFPIPNGSRKSAKNGLFWASSFWRFSIGRAQKLSTSIFSLAKPLLFHTNLALLALCTEIQLLGTDTPPLQTTLFLSLQTLVSPLSSHSVHRHFRDTPQPSPCKIPHFAIGLWHSDPNINCCIFVGAVFRSLKSVLHPALRTLSKIADFFSQLSCESSILGFLHSPSHLPSWGP